jgi:phage gpG-like protein
MAAEEWTAILTRDIEAAAERASNMLPAWKASAEAIREHVEQRFQTSTAPDGEPWAPLSERYLNAMKVTRGPLTRGADGRFRKGIVTRTPRRKDGKILIQDRRLANSCRAGIVEESDGVIMASDVVYAPTHQFGDEDRGIPARPFFPVLPDGTTAFTEGTPAGELFSEIEATILDWLDVLDERGRARAMGG